MISNCKHCNNHSLSEIKDFEWLNEEDVIELINVQKCTVCGCLHWENETHMFYEYLCKQKTNNTMVKYTSDYDLAVAKK